MTGVLTVHTTALATSAQAVDAETGVRFAGCDSSAAPSKATASIVDLYKLLGVVEDTGQARPTSRSLWCKH